MDGWVGGLAQLTLGECRVHPGQVASLLQGWQRKKTSHIHTYRQFQILWQFHNLKIMALIMTNKSQTSCSEEELMFTVTSDCFLFCEALTLGEEGRLGPYFTFGLILIWWHSHHLETQNCCWYFTSGDLVTWSSPLCCYSSVRTDSLLARNINAVLLCNCELEAVCLQFKVWVKPGAEQSFLYGNHVLKSGLGRITENTMQYQGVVVYSMADVPLVSFGTMMLCRSQAWTCYSSTCSWFRRSCWCCACDSSETALSLFPEGISETVSPLRVLVWQPSLPRSVGEWIPCPL